MTITRMNWEPVRAYAQSWLDDNVNNTPYNRMTTRLKVVELRSTSDPYEMTGSSQSTRRFVQGPIDYHLVDQFGGQHPVPPDVVNGWLTAVNGGPLQEAEARAFPITEKLTAMLFPKMTSIVCHPSHLTSEWANVIVRTAATKVYQGGRYIEPHTAVIEQTLAARGEFLVILKSSTPDNDIHCYVQDQELSMVEVTHCMWCGEAFPGQEACEAHEEDCGN